MIYDWHGTGRKNHQQKQRKVIVTFTSHENKNNFLKARKIVQNLSTKSIGFQQDNPIYIREHLTLYGNMLFKLDRDFNYKFVWTINEKILIRKTENLKIIRIENEQIINAIK
ncbi:Hypothetical protein CINCED_3A006596, partial [Cinara cedri]